MHGAEYVAVGLDRVGDLAYHLHCREGPGLAPPGEADRGSPRRAAAQLPQEPSATAEHVQMLEDRLRVVERIVTDRGYNLAGDIEALRDRSPARQTKESE